MMMLLRAVLGIRDSMMSANLPAALGLYSEFVKHLALDADGLPAQCVHDRHLARLASPLLTHSIQTHVLPFLGSHRLKLELERDKVVAPLDALLVEPPLLDEVLVQRPPSAIARGRDHVDLCCSSRPPRPLVRKDRALPAPLACLERCATGEVWTGKRVEQVLIEARWTGERDKVGEVDEANSSCALVYLSTSNQPLGTDMTAAFHLDEGSESENRIDSSSTLKTVDVSSRERAETGAHAASR